MPSFPPTLSCLDSCTRSLSRTLELTHTCAPYSQQTSKTGDRIEVALEIAKMAKIVSISLDEDEPNDGKEFPCINVETPVLQKVVEYCTYHETHEKMNDIKSPLNGETVQEILKQDWYAAFCEGLDRQMMFDLVAAANYMDIKPLLDLSCLAVSIHIKGKTVEELQQIFNITPPQKAAAAAAAPAGGDSKPESATD